MSDPTPALQDDPGQLRGALEAAGAVLLDPESGRLPAWIFPQEDVPPLPAEARGSTVAPLEDGKVPEEYLPEPEPPAHGALPDGSRLTVTEQGLVWVRTDGSTHVLAPPTNAQEV